MVKNCGTKDGHLIIRVRTMKEYSFTEARQHFAAILEEAKREGAVCIKKRNGEAFFIKPAISKKSPLDIKWV